MQQSYFRPLLYILIGLLLGIVGMVLLFPLKGPVKDTVPSASPDSSPITDPSDPSVIQPGGSIDDQSGNAVDIVPTPPISDQPSSSACGIESCHGLDISCGPNVPEMCTMEYRFGDFCRQFAQCQILDGNCTYIANSYFMNCRTCVQECNRVDDPMAAFECEAQCREQFE